MIDNSSPETVLSEPILSETEVETQKIQRLLAGDTLYIEERSYRDYGNVEVLRMNEHGYVSPHFTEFQTTDPGQNLSKGFIWSSLDGTKDIGDYPDSLEIELFVWGDKTKGEYCVLYENEYKESFEDVWKHVVQTVIDSTEDKYQDTNMPEKVAQEIHYAKQWLTHFDERLAVNRSRLQQIQNIWKYLREKTDLAGYPSMFVQAAHALEKGLQINGEKYDITKNLATARRSLVESRPAEGAMRRENRAPNPYKAESLLNNFAAKIEEGLGCTLEDLERTIAEIKTSQDKYNAMESTLFNKVCPICDSTLPCSNHQYSFEHGDIFELTSTNTGEVLGLVGVSSRKSNIVIPTEKKVQIHPGDIVAIDNFQIGQIPFSLADLGLERWSHRTPFETTETVTIEQIPDFITRAITATEQRMQELNKEMKTAPKRARYVQMQHADEEKRLKYLQDAATKIDAYVQSKKLNASR